MNPTAIKDDFEKKDTVRGGKILQIIEEGI